jgi:DNA-binding MarR family transcriptional regulator
MSREEHIQHIIQSFVAFRKGLVKDEHGVSHAQADALFCVFENDSLTVGELAQLLHITPGAATQLTDSLMKAEHIVRKPDLKDRRVTRIKLSKEGLGFLEEAKKQKLQKLQKVLAPLTDSELQMLAELLGKVSKSVQDYKGE